MKQLGLGWDCNLHFLPLTFHRRFGISRLFASVCAVWRLAPRRPSPAHLSFVFCARPHWACGAGGEESGVGSRRPRFPRGRSPAPQDPQHQPKDRGEVRGQFLRRGSPRLDPRSQPPGVEGGAAHQRAGGWRQNREGVGWWSGRIRSRDS